MQRESSIPEASKVKILCLCYTTTRGSGNSEIGVKIT